MVRWYKGLNGAKSGDRLRLLAAERQAKQMALASCVDQRLSSTSDLICDCTDIEVLGARLTWCRKRGRILVQITVFMMPGATPHTFRWRLLE